MDETTTLTKGRVAELTIVSELAILQLKGGLLLVDGVPCSTKKHLEAALKAKFPEAVAFKTATRKPREPKAPGAQLPAGAKKR